MPVIISAALTYFGASAAVTVVGTLVASAVYANHQKRKLERRARNAYNASLRDRLEMVDLTPDAPRTLVLGRVRAVEGVRRRWVSGINSERLTMVVSFAGHRIDGFEQWYLDDKPVSLDGAGWVTTEPYLKGTRRSASKRVTMATGGSVTLDHPPIVGTVAATWSTGRGLESGVATVVSIVGNVVTLSGVPSEGRSLNIGYQWLDNATSTCRIRPYLGTDAQNVGADLASEYPGKITATDRFAGIALAVVDVLYDPDIYPQGRPNVSAVMRGARVYDPRSDSTVPGGSGSQRANDTATWAWSDNAALCTNRYATWAHGYALPVAETAVADVMAAANASDVSTSFTLRKPDGATSTVTLPRYRCGIVIPSDADPRTAMADLLETMNGRAGWAGGVWRFRAGALATPSFALDASWLALPQGDAAGTVISMANGVLRDDAVNRVTGTCVDPDQRWQVLPFPAVQDAALIAAKGEEPVELELQGVTHIAHAQHLASMMIRQAQAGLRITAQCNMHAYRCELFDVGNLVLPRYGMTAELGKLAEVVGWAWHPTQAVQLQLAEISSAMFQPLAELAGRDPAPNAALPPLGQVDELTITSITSGTEPLTDGSVLTRTRVEWTPSVQESIRQGGQIEVQYLPIDDSDPPADWPTWTEQGSASSAVLPSLLAGTWHVFRIRAVKPMLGVRGPWSKQVVHMVAMPPLASVKFLRLRSTAMAISYAEGGAATPSSVTLTAELGGSLTGTVAWSIVAGTATLSGSGNSRTLAAADLASDSVTINISLDGFADTVTIVKVRDGATGPAGGRSALVYAYQRASSAPALPSAAVTYTFATGAVSGLNNGWQASPPAGSLPLYVTVATASATGATDTIAAGEWAAAVVLAQNGADGTPGAAGAAGADGLNAATVYLFQRSSSATPPALPSGTVTYTFATATADGVNNGWQQTLPATGGPYRWVTTATALGAGSTDSLAPAEWAAASLLAQDGANGANGSNGSDGRNNATVYIYQRSSGAPALPSVTASYVFDSASLTGLNNGWQTSPPAGSLPLYVSVATASSTGANDTIAPGEWATPVLLAQNGADGSNGSDGSNGINVATVYLFRRTTTDTPPALPSASVVFTFATGVASGVDNGWQQSLPTTGGTYRWITTATALSTGTTDTLAPAEWAAASLLAQDGANGADGADGLPAVSAGLDRYAVSFTADVAGVVDAGQSFAVTMQVRLGTSDDTNNWSITRSSSDASITTTQAGAVITITGIGTSVNAGSVTITATRAGYPTQALVVDVSKSRRALPNNGPVALAGQLEVVASVLSPTDATAKIQIDTDGQISGWVNGVRSTIGNWYLANTTGIGAGYEARFDLLTLSGNTTGTTANALASWGALSTDRYVQVQYTSNSATFTQRQYSFAIRRISDGVQVCTGQVYLECAVESP